MDFAHCHHHIWDMLLENNKLVKAGLWFMDKWSKTKSIQQLSMTDTK